jgi:trimethylamine-N-oxide reductase (cytochrome c)
VVVESTDLLVFWGANPRVTNQIDWLIAEHGGMKGLDDFKATGKPVICIDPERSETCEHMGAEWIAPRPQTDVAMMLGIAHTLHAEGLADEDFLADYTSGYDKFLPYLTGESDGQPKDADWAAEICDVPADTLRDLARRFAASRTMLAGGWSIQRQHLGEQRHWMMVTLAAMLGQIGLPGGGFGFSYHYSNGGSPSANRPGAVGDHRWRPLGRRRGLADRQWRCNHSRGAGGRHAREPRRRVRFQR